MEHYYLPNRTLCLVVGVPGSGKSTFARELARALRNGCYLSKDMVQSQFTSTERVTGETYSFVQGPTHALLQAFASENLSLGKVPVIDAPMSINHWRRDHYSNWCAHYRDTAALVNAQLAIIRLRPPNEEELRRRIFERDYPWDRGKLNSWAEFMAKEPMAFPIDHDRVLDLVSNCPPAALVAIAAERFLGASLVAPAMATTVTAESADAAQAR